MTAPTTARQLAAARPMSEADAAAIRADGLTCGNCGSIFGHPMALRDHMRDAHTSFTTLERYWNDPDFRARLDAETQANRDRANAAIDAGLAKHRAAQEARLSNEGNG